MTEHPKLESLLAGRDLDSPVGERSETLRHVAGCAVCRRLLAERDPARLFALLSLAAPPAGALERLSIDVERSVSAAAPRRSRSRVAFAGLAASVAAALLLGGLLWRDSGPVEGLPLSVPPPAALAGARGGVRMTPSIEVSSPPSAQLVDLAIGDTQLILIFDEGFDL